MTDILDTVEGFISFCRSISHLSAQEMYDKVYEESASAKSKNQKELIDLVMTTRGHLGV
jgi:hypothetical protein